MKIKGRLIATLAALGLLIAMLPIGPAFAAEGKVGIKGGGEDGKFFSDKTGYNVVTLSVTDQDLSPARVGFARFTYDDASPNTPTFNLTDGTLGGDGTMVLAGEKGKTDELDGALYEATAPIADPADPQTAEVNAQLAEYVALATGAGTDKTFHYIGADDQAGGADDRWVITLSEIARDKDGNGDVDDDDITVVVDGTEKTATTEYALGGAIGASTLTAQHVVLLLTAPTASTNNINVTYEYSEFDQGTPANTPITLSGTRVKYGASFKTLNSEVNVSRVAAGVVTTTDSVADTGIVVEIQFVYNVKEKAKKFAVVTSNTSIAGGQNLTLDGAETSADSSKFEVMIAVFENSDYSKIVNEANNLANASDDDEGVQVSELCATNALGSPTADSGSICDRVTQAAAMVDPAETKATELVKLLLPVADKDTLTVVYADESPSATITKSAEIDLAAPVVTLISPTQKLYTSESLLTLSAEVVDEGSGVKQSNIGLFYMNNTTGLNLNQANTLRSPIRNGYRVSNVPTSAISEGKKEWAIQVVDNVGNKPLKKLETPAVTAEDGTVTKKAVVIRKAALGAVGFMPPDVTSTNPFIFYVDISGPKVASAKTGLYLKKPRRNNRRGRGQGDPEDQQPELGEGET